MIMEKHFDMKNSPQSPPAQLCDDSVTDLCMYLLTGAHYQLATQGQITREMLFISFVLYCLSRAEASTSFSLL